MRFAGVLVIAIGISISVYMGFKGLSPTQMAARLLALFKLPNPYHSLGSVTETAPGANLPGGIPLGVLRDPQGPQQPDASSSSPSASSPTVGGLATGFVQ